MTGIEEMLSTGGGDHSLEYSVSWSESTQPSARYSGEELVSGFHSSVFAMTGLVLELGITEFQFTLKNKHLCYIRLADISVLRRETYI